MDWICPLRICRRRRQGHARSSYLDHLLSGKMRGGRRSSHPKAQARRRTGHGAGSNKSSALAFMNSAVLLLLRCTERSAHAVAETKLNRAALHDSACWSKQRRNNQVVTAAFVASPFKSQLPRRGDGPSEAAARRGWARASSAYARELRRARLHAMQGTHGAANEVSNREIWSTAAAGTEDAAAVDTGGVVGAEGETGGFGWVREYGNGKMDIAGLVLSTVLLMTAAAPLG